LGGALPPEDEILPAAAGLTGGENVSYYILRRKAIVEGSDFRSISPGTTSNTGQF
jgi:hypothetical protein